MATLEILTPEKLLSRESFWVDHGLSSGDPELDRLVVDHIELMLARGADEFYGTSLMGQPGVEPAPLYELLMALVKADLLEVRKQALGTERAGQAPIISFALAKTALAQTLKQLLIEQATA